MLTDLSFLTKGLRFPPDDHDTNERFRKYVDYKNMWNNEHGKIQAYERDFARIERVIGNFHDVISYATIINYHRLCSKKIADLLVGEPPNFETENKELLDEVLEEADFNVKMYQNILDLSRFGDAVFQVHQEDGYLSVLSPESWIPIFDPNNRNKITHHVIFNIIKQQDNNFKLYVDIHEKGSILHSVYQLKGSILGGFFVGELLEEYTEATGLDDFDIIHTTNLITSDCAFGISDYEDIDNIIRELLVRVSQISRILDKHASPTVSAPASTLMQNPETGEWEMRMGDMFVRNDKEDPTPEYITWDGELDAAFKQVEFFVNQLYVISEMGSLLLGGEDKGGSNMSGRALKFKMLSPLAKAKRISMFINYKVKKLLRLMGVYAGVNLDKVSITWNDGIPNDELEEAEIIEKRTNTGTMSKQRAMEKYDNMTEEDAQNEIDTIINEENMMNPLAQEPFSGENKLDGMGNDVL